MSSRSPALHPFGINLYTYAGNNPINATDPLGLEQSPVGHLDWFSRSLSPTGGPPSGISPNLNPNSDRHIRRNKHNVCPSKMPDECDESGGVFDSNGYEGAVHLIV